MIKTKKVRPRFWNRLVESFVEVSFFSGNNQNCTAMNYMELFPYQFGQHGEISFINTKYLGSQNLINVIWFLWKIIDFDRSKSIIFQFFIRKLYRQKLGIFGKILFWVWNGPKTLPVTSQSKIELKKSHFDHFWPTRFFT